MKRENELPVVKCRLCGEEFRQKRHDQTFCSSAHRQKFHRRKEVRGAQAYEALMTWRKTRGGKKGVLGDIAAMVDRWIAEDKKGK